MQRENITTPIYVQCNNKNREKVWAQEFLHIVSGLDIQLEQPEMLRTTILHAKNLIETR